MNYLKWLTQTYFREYDTTQLVYEYTHCYQILEKTYKYTFASMYTPYPSLSDNLEDSKLTSTVYYPYHVAIAHVYLTWEFEYFLTTVVPNDKKYETIFYKLVSMLRAEFNPYIDFSTSRLHNVLSRLNAFWQLLLFNFKWILLAGLIAIIYFFISLFYIQIDFAKQIAVWYILLISYYLLMSTFNSFLNKYRYGKFTSAIQRFWKRTGMIFWLLEGFLFLIFFYYFLNSSQEPLYMFDYSNLNQELLIQLKSTYKNMILLSLAIYLSFILILQTNFLVYYQNIILLSLISLIVFYTLYIESYQFVYIISLFADKTWTFDEASQIWVLDVEQNNLRVKQQYFILCLIAKYWHFIFIFISWFFFLIKSLEVGKVNITLLGYNVQNLVILYILNLMCLAQWVKYLTKKFLEITYYWFFIQYDEKFIFTFLNEVWTTLTHFVTFTAISTVLPELTYLSSILFTSSDLVLWKHII